MKKQAFRITINEAREKQAVTGLVSKNFGIHKQQKDNFTVTHLKTGYGVVWFPYQKQARHFVTQAEKIPEIETMDLENATTFTNAIQKIIKKTWKI